MLLQTGCVFCKFCLLFLTVRYLNRTVCCFSCYRTISRCRAANAVLPEDPARHQHVSGPVQCLLAIGCAQHCFGSAAGSLVSISFCNIIYQLHNCISYKFNSISREKFTCEPRLLLGLARIYDMLNDPETAITYYKKVSTALDCSSFFYLSMNILRHGEI